MNKIHIKARFNDENVSSYLVRSFFFDFKSKGSIDIKDGRVEMILMCDDEPTELIDTITYFCTIDEFHMDEALDNPAEAKTETVISVPSDIHAKSEKTDYEEEQSIEADAKDSFESNASTEIQDSDGANVESKDVSIKTEFKTVVPVETLVKAEVNSAEPEKVDTEQPDETKNTESVYIPELREFAEKASSFKEFASLVAEWINFGRRNELFVQIATAATQVERVSWSELSEKVFVTQTDKMQMGRNAAPIFKKYSLRMLSFLKLLVKFNKYFTGTEEKVTNNEISESEIQNQQNDELKNESADDVVSDKIKVKMHCIPEIQCFESALESIDKSQPIEERTKKILSVMAGDGKIEENVFIIVNTAITVKKIDISSILKESDLNSKEYGSAWMLTSQFINNFVQKYQSDFKVKTVDFLKELQKIILTEEEFNKL